MIFDELRFFKKSEFTCKCGCNRTYMNPDFLKKLDDARSRFDFPFFITSGYRCPEYNERISTTGRTGPHTTGRAVDIQLFGKNAFRVIQQCSLGGWFTGIGLHQRGPHAKRFIHLDDLTEDDNRARPTVWTY